MSPAAAKVLDFNRPESAKQVGGELATTSQALATRLEQTAVTDLASCEQAVLDRQTLGDAITRVETFFEPFVAMAHQLHKALCDRRTEILAPLKRLDVAKREAIRTFKEAQDRIREQRERELAEARRKEEEARAVAEAAHYESSGDHEMATAILAEAIAAPMPIAIVEDQLDQIEGLHFTRRWLWKFSGGPRLTPAEMLKKTPPQFVARSMNLIPREFLCVDVAKVTKHVNAHKGSAKIPGIDVYYVDDPRR
jgi:hypothetical protein